MADLVLEEFVSPSAFDYLKEAFGFAEEPTSEHEARKTEIAVDTESEPRKFLRLYADE